MAPPQRITFISDATKEFPNNKNNSFKMRLPNQLQLPGDNWYASLWSISVPDEAFTSKSMVTDADQIVHFAYTTYKLDNYQSGFSEYARLTPTRYEVRLSTTEVMGDNQPVKTGVELWQNVKHRLDTIMQDKLRSHLSSSYTPPVQHTLYEEWKPHLIMKDNAFVLPAVSSYSVADTGNTSRSWLGIKLDVAVKFGFLNENQNGLGPNVRAEYPTFDETGGSIRTSVMNTYQVAGNTQRAILTRDIDHGDPRVDWFLINRQSKWIYFSRALQWTFFRLNESFEALLNTKETVMVYSDLVQSSVVGTGRYPLLREVTLERTGKGRVTMEPRHREWIPVRSKTIDIVEMELATASGPLTQLTPGKTIVTVGLQQL